MMFRCIKPWTCNCIPRVEPPPLSEVHQFLREGDKLQWGNLQAQLFTLPDTRPAIPVFSFPPIQEKVTIAAPQLFARHAFCGSIGRTDLWGGSMEK